MGTGFNIGDRVRVEYEGRITGKGYSRDKFFVASTDGESYVPHAKHITKLTPQEPPIGSLLHFENGEYWMRQKYGYWTRIAKKDVAFDRWNVQWDELANREFTILN